MMEKESQMIALKKKSDMQLVEILYFQKSDYNYTALQNAKQLLKERGVTNHEIKALKKRIRQQRRKEYLQRKKETTSSGIIEFIADFLLLALFDND